MDDLYGTNFGGRTVRGFPTRMQAVDVSVGVSVAGKSLLDAVAGTRTEKKFKGITWQPHGLQHDRRTSL